MNDEAKENKADFMTFISGLMMEGLVALGVMKHPLSDDNKKDLNHASMVIDSIAMLKEKTEGNLSEEETGSIENMLNQLRMGYVAEISKEEKEQEKGADKK